MLEIQELSHAYIDGDVKRIVLENVNASFECGAFYTILGPSGSGKSTLLSLMAGLDDVQTGAILLNGTPIQSKGLTQYRRNQMAIVFQAFNLIPYLTAVENVELAMNITQNEMPSNKREVALGFLEKLGISKIKAHQYITKLSGGEQQRVAIARSLVTGADYIFADEPTGNLDSQTEQEIIALFQTLAHQFQKCLIVVTHSERVATKSDVTYRIEDGRLTHQVV